MKILFAIKAINQAKGGAERVLADVTAELARRGHEVTLLTFDAASAETFYPLSPAIRRLPLGRDDAMRPASLLDTLNRIFKLRKTVRAERPDIVVAFMHSMFIPAAFACAGLGIPFLASEHIVREHYVGRKIEFLLFLISSVFINGYTVLSESIRQSYPALIRRKMHVVPNPVATAAFRADVGDTRTLKKILSVGRLERQKRQDILIAAFSSLAEKYPDWVLEIVGEGALKEALITQIATGNSDAAMPRANYNSPDWMAELASGDDLESKVTPVHLSLKVFILPPTRNIGEVYASAQIFAIPSAYESFGLATAEAMAHGLPAIGFKDCPGTNELIHDNVNGLLVQSGQNDDDRIAAFAQALDHLMGAPDFRARLGGKAVEISSLFGIQPIADKWENLISKIASRG